MFQDLYELQLAPFTFSKKAFQKTKNVNFSQICLYPPQKKNLYIKYTFWSPDLIDFFFFIIICYASVLGQEFINDISEFR